MAFNAGSITATLELDRTPFQRGLDEARRQAVEFQRNKITAQVDADTASVKAKLFDVQQQLNRLGTARPSVKVDADTAAATAKLAALQGEVDRLDGRRANVDVNVDDHGSTNATTGRLGALVAAAAAFAGPIGGAAVGLLALGSAGVVGAAGLGAVALGSSGVAAALKAQDAAEKASTQGAAAQATANKRLAESMAQLSPAGRSFVGLLDELKPKLHELQMTAQQGFLPGLQAGIQALVPLFQQINSNVGVLSRSMGAFFQTIGQGLAQPYWQGFFSTLSTASTTLMPLFAQSLLTAGRGFTTLVTDMLPVAPQALGVASAFGDLVGQLAPFIAQASGPLLSSLSNLIGDLRPLGPLLADLAPIAKDVSDTVGSLLATALITVDHIVRGLAPVVHGLAVAIQAIPEPVQAAALAFVGLRLAAGPINGVLMGAAVGMQTLGLRAATFAEQGTAFSGAATATAGAATRVSGALSKAAGAIPLLGAVVIGGVEAWNSLTISTDDAARQMGRTGEMSAALVTDLATQNDVTGGLAAGLNEVTKKYNDQLNAMSPVELATTSVTQAQNRYDDAVKQFTSTSPQAIAAQQGLRDAVENQGRAQQDAANATKTANDRLQDQFDLLLKTTGSNFAAQAALAALQQAQRNGSVSVAELNQRSLDYIGTVENTFVQQAKLQGNTDLTSASMAGQRQAILDLVGVYHNNLPPAVQSYIAGMTDSQLAAIGARRETDNLGRSVITLPGQNGKPVHIEIASNAPVVNRQVQDLQTSLTDISKVWHITVATNATTGTALDVLPPARAAGGYITGGMPGQDSVLSLLMPGEYVLRRSAVQALGVDYLHHLNRFAAGGLVRRYADGGPVTPSAPGAVLGAGAAAGQPVAPDGTPLTADQVNVLAAATSALTAAETALTAVLVAQMATGWTPLVGQLTGPVTAALGGVVGLADGPVTAALHQFAFLTGTVDVQATQTFVNVGLIPLQGQLQLTAAVTADTMGRATGSVQNMVAASNAAFGGLRAGLGGVDGAVGYTATWFADRMASMRASAADPVRFVISGPFNAGIIAAWNTLDSQFSLGKHVADIVPGFAEGGPLTGGIPGQDSILMRGMPGEFVLNVRDVANLGGVHSVERLRQQAAARSSDGTFSALQSGHLVEGAEHTGTGYSTVGYGGVRPWVAQTGHFIQQMFGVADVGGVGSRPNVSDHPRGLALDFMVYRDAGKGNAIADHLIANAAHHAIKYLIWQQRYNEGSGWSRMEDRGSVTANHYDHVHTSFLDSPFGGHGFSGGGDAGSMLDVGATVNAAFANTYRLIDDAAGRYAGNIMGSDGAAIARIAADRVKAYGTDRITSLFSFTGGGGGDVSRWDPLILRALAELGQSPNLLGAVERRIQFESGGNPNAINLTDCVPLSTMILTRRGWLKHDEVRAGDETIGYNRETGRSEWTQVTRVVHYADAPLTRIGNSRWYATTTGNHRWLSKPRITVPKTVVVETDSGCPLCAWPEGIRRRGAKTGGGLRIHLAKAHQVKAERSLDVYAIGAEFVTTDDIDSRDRLVLAAPADTSGSLDVTVTEAAILGWIAGDGHVETIKHRPTMSIAQSRPAMVAKLRELLADVPHSLYVDERLTRTGKVAIGPRHVWRIRHEYAQDLLRRAGHPKHDAVTQVLAMSTEQRVAWLEAMIDAEGHRAMRPGYTKPRVQITQTYGTVLDAVTIAVYLDGHRPSVLDRKVTHSGWSPSADVFLNGPIVRGNFLTKEDAGRGDVWCVTTELGTWTAREDNHVFLTGNSNARAGHPSQGLMQVIPSTFAGNAGPYVGLGITNPYANIYAGLHYALGRYGSIAAIDPRVRPMGYDAGGSLPAGATLAVNASGRPEQVLTDVQWQALIGQARDRIGGDGGAAVADIKADIAELVAVIRAQRPININGVDYRSIESLVEAMFRRLAFDLRIGR